MPQKKVSTKIKRLLAVFTLFILNIACLIGAIATSGSRIREPSSEPRPGCGTIATVLRMELAENDGVFAKCLDGPAIAIPEVSREYLDGKKFDAEDYVISGTSTNNGYYLITCSGNKQSGRGKWEGCADGIVVTLDADGNYIYEYNPPREVKPRPINWNLYLDKYGTAFFSLLLIGINIVAAFLWHLLL